MIKIGFDAKRAAVNKVGLGSYSRNLIRHLAHFYPNNKYYLYSSRAFLPEYKDLLEHPSLVLREPEKKSSQIISALWKMGQLSELVKKDGIQVFHGLSHTLPRGLKCPKVVTMHDLIFLRHPNWFKWHDRLSYKYRFQRAANLSDKIIAISESTRRDLIEFYKVPENKIEVTFQPCSERFQKVQLGKEDQSRLRIQYALPERFIVCVGTVEPRKNALLAVQAFHALGGKTGDTELLIIGKPTDYAKEIQDFIDSKRVKNVRLLPYVELDDLIGIYNLATLSVYIPFYEGFGLPVLESMQCGVPVVISKESSLPEVGGDAAFYVDPHSLESVVEALDCALNNQAEYQKRVNLLPEQIAKFEPSRVTERVMGVYQGLL